MELIKYWDEDVGNFFYGYIFKKDNHAHVVDPLCYEMLMYNKKEDWLHIVPKRLVSLTDIIELKNETLFPSDLWVFNFEIVETDKEYIAGIANFFEHYLMNKTLPFQKRLEEALKWTTFMFPETVKHRLIHFVQRKRIAC